MIEHPALYPLLLESTLHIKVWGGQKLASIMHKPVPTSEPYGESWEIHDNCLIQNGVLAGQTLGQVLKDYGTALVGPDNDPTQGFPLLAKLLDAAMWLSIQVHPNDAQAADLEKQPRGKTEAWYIIAADPGTQLVIGVKPGTSKADMAKAIQENTLEALLVYADVTNGDTLYIPAGTIHAIGPGTLIYEIQQSSDTTYRLYDWGRMGLDGKPRPLHIEKGVQVSNTDFLPEITHPGKDSNANVPVVEGEFFTTMLHRLNASSAALPLNTHQQRFQTLTCIEGIVQIVTGENNHPLTTGQSAVIPATVGEYQLQGTGVVLRSWQTDAVMNHLLGNQLE